MIETFDCKSLITPKLGKKMRVLAPWSSNFLCLSKGFFFRFSKVWVCFHGRSPLLGDHQRKHLKSLRIILEHRLSFSEPSFCFWCYFGKRGKLYILALMRKQQACVGTFSFFLSLMIQQNADRWPYWVLFRWLNCNMWSWFEWHTYAADREDCCIQSWSMTCLRVWSIPEGRWKEEAVTRTLATTQRVWMPNLMGEKSRRKGLWWWFCDSMATRP